MDDEDARREKINGTVSGLLALLAVEADRELALVGRPVFRQLAAAGIEVRE